MDIGKTNMIIKKLPNKAKLVNRTNRTYKFWLRMYKAVSQT